MKKALGIIYDIFSFILLLMMILFFVKVFLGDLIIVSPIQLKEKYIELLNEKEKITAIRVEKNAVKVNKVKVDTLKK